MREFDARGHPTLVVGSFVECTATLVVGSSVVECTDVEVGVEAVPTVETEPEPEPVEPTPLLKGPLKRPEEYCFSVSSMRSADGFRFPSVIRRSARKHSGGTLLERIRTGHIVIPP